MKNMPDKVQVRHYEADSAHAFQAIGTTSFIKCILPSLLEWQADKPVRIGAESGMAEIGDSIRILKTGEFELLPFDALRMTLRFSEPVYYLTIQKIYEILCRRYVFNVKLYSKWELNMWPLFLDYYLQHGEWAGTIEQMYEFGNRIFADVRKNATPQLRRLSRFERIKKQFPIIVITRLNARSTLREWAKKHWAAIYRKFFNSPDFEEMNGNAALLKSLTEKRDGLVPLKSVRKEDDFAFAMPFELAVADSLQCKNTVGLSRTDRRYLNTNRSKVALSARFDGVTLARIPLPCSLSGERVQIPLLSGAKEVYGAKMGAPIIIKGTNVKGTIDQNNPDLDGRLKSAILNFLIAGRTASVSENPADLKVRVAGIES